MNLAVSDVSQLEGVQPGCSIESVAYAAIEGALGDAVAQRTGAQISLLQ